jgi:serine/threonine protein kinase
MVAGDGTVRLLDFGIGKLLSDDLPPELQLSRLHGQPLTPAYASPEQLMAADAGLTSDVYSLGVVLYELLTGERPYQYRRGSNREHRQAILESIPNPPSQKLIDQALEPSWRPRLDAIVLKALEKLPGKRFGTAGELTTALEALQAI